MITLTPEQVGGLFLLALALGYAVIRWRDARNDTIKANAKRIEYEAAADKLESETSSAAVKAVTEGFAKKDTEVSALNKRNGELEADVAKWKTLAEERWKTIEEKNVTIAGMSKQLSDCASVNQNANERLLAVTGELESIRAQYADEIASTINRHLNEDKDKPNE